MVKISLCMIVKDEEEVLERCLNQVKGLVDEIIILDTGSQDSTREIACRYADRVEDFVWQKDFAAARNASFALAKGDYCMWLDADDVITSKEQEKFRKARETLSLDIDMVFMDYAVSFDENGDPDLIYPRERLIRNGKGFLWKGRVHEAIKPSGKIIHLPVVIEHRKVKSGDPDRNLRIYEKMLEEKEAFDARAHFYYGRELAGHCRWEEALKELELTAADKEAWVENRISACLDGASCAVALGQQEKALTLLFQSFAWDTPRAEICCEAGRIFIDQQRYDQAAYWYERALDAKDSACSGAFYYKRYHGYIPWIQLCVCYYKMGRYDKACQCHLRAKELWPEAKEVKANEAFFGTK